MHKKMPGRVCLHAGVRSVGEVHSLSPDPVVILQNVMVTPISEFAKRMLVVVMLEAGAFCKMDCNLCTTIIGWFAAPRN